MKHANKMTLILPEYLTLSQFEEIINLALENCEEEYIIDYWDGEKNCVQIKSIDIKNHSLKHIDGYGLIMEFEKNE